MIPKRKTFSLQKRATPLQGSGVYKKQTALPLPEPRQIEDTIPPDSTPTPVIDLGWRSISDRLQIMSDDFLILCLRFQKHPIKMNLKLSKVCKELSDDCLNIRGRVNSWPNLSAGGLAGERSWVTDKYLKLMKELQNMKVIAHGQ